MCLRLGVSPSESQPLLDTSAGVGAERVRNRTRLVWSVVEHIESIARGSGTPRLAWVSDRRVDSAVTLKALVPSLDALLQREETALAELQQRVTSGEVSLEQAHHELVEIVLGRLDGYGAVVRDHMRAKLLDVLAAYPYFDGAARSGEEVL